MFESKQKKLLDRRAFWRRQTRFAFIALLILLFALGVGVLGYHCLGRLSWIDALLNASMILSGMGPADPLHDDAAKIFASVYALFSGITFISAAGTLFAPIYHRFLHRFHLDKD